MLLTHLMRVSCSYDSRNFVPNQSVRVSAALTSISTRQGSLSNLTVDDSQAVDQALLGFQRR